MKRLIPALTALVLSAPAFAAGTLADVTVYRPLHRTSSCPCSSSDGQAFVAGAPGNEYAIRIRNRSSDDLLAVVSVDGVNAVTGQTASPAQGGYVIAARGYLEIKGWRKSLERTAAFYFTDLGDSYAARTGRPDNVGVIGVALFKRKPEPVGVVRGRSAGASGTCVRGGQRRKRRTAGGKSAGTRRGGAAAGHRARPQRDLVRTLRAVRARIGRTQRSGHDSLRQPRQSGRARRHPGTAAGATARTRSVPAAFVPDPPVVVAATSPPRTQGRQGMRRSWRQGWRLRSCERSGPTLSTEQLAPCVLA